MRMTMPQILMLTHASFLNGKRMESRTKQDAGDDMGPGSDPDPVVFKGKRLSELNSDELMDYYAAV